MPKEEIKDLAKFLKPFPADIKERALWLREFVWDLYPDSNELIYDNYNAVAFGWSLTDKLGQTFCTMAVGRTSSNIHFGFYYGNVLADPKGILLGEGNQYRYILVGELSAFPKTYIKSLLKEAYNRAKTGLKPGTERKHGVTILKSVSAKKRAPALKKKAAKKKK